MMMIKGCLLALVISSTYAAEDRSGGGGGGANRARNGVRTYNGPYKEGGANSGYGKSKVATNRRWGNRRRRPMPGRIRRRKPRPANWVRPSRPANWQGPTESENYDSGESNDGYTDSGDGYTDNGYDNCDAQLRSTCCDLPDNLSVQEKKNICYAVGCNYDKCDWSDDGYETLKPTSEPTWSADGWQRDGWNDDGHNLCLAADQAMCCNLPASISDYKKISLCDKLGCDYDKCNWRNDGWKHYTDEPTSDPTISPTVHPTIYPTSSPTGPVCDVQSRDICCNQSDKLSVVNKKRVCDKLGCMYKKCGWKRDGYDDDDSKPAWKNDGYNNDYDDKDDVDYNKVKDLYDEQWNNYKEKNNGGNDYTDDNYGSDDDKYDHVNDYDDDKCTSEERRVCCTANEKKQWKVCNILGCNMKKCDKRDWDDDGGYDANDINKVRYNNNNNNNNIPTKRPTWRNSPYYMDSYNDIPTPRPTWRKYSTNTGQGYQGGSYAPPVYNPSYNNIPTPRPQWRTYSTNTGQGWQGGSYAPPVYYPYAPATPYNPYSIYTPPTWQGDTYNTGYKASEPADSTWQGDTYNTGYKAAEPDNSWAGDSYKKYKKEKPSASPTQSPAPSVSLEPSMSPTESFAPSVSIAPSKAKKRPKSYGGGGYKHSYTKKYDQDMKTMKEDLQELKQLLQMSIAEEADEDDTATEAAYAETNQLKDELAQLKLLIADAYVRDVVGEEDTDYLETTLSEVEAEVVQVEEVLEEEVKKEDAEKVEAEVVEVEEVLEEEVKKEDAEKVEAEVVEVEKVLEEKVKEEKVKEEKAEKVEAEVVEVEEVLEDKRAKKTEKTDKKKKGE